MSSEQTEKVLHQFNEVFRLHDPSLLDDLIGQDCVLENSGPAPDGSRHVGYQACRDFWGSIASTTALNFDPEEVWAAGERGIIRWRLRYGPGPADSVRGVNLMRVVDGKIVEGMGYVKGAS